MSFELKEAVYEDMDEVADVFLKSFSEDPLMAHMMPLSQIPYETVHAWWAADFKLGVKTPGVKFFKMADTNTGAVAFSRWHYPVPTKEDASHAEEPPPPAGSNMAICEEFFTKHAQMQAKYVDDKTSFVYLLGTLKSHHRMGLGARILKHGLAIAAEQNLRTYIEGTPAGTPLYRKLGWKDVDVYKPVDFKKHGVEGWDDFQWVCLMREPEEKTQEM